MVRIVIVDDNQLALKRCEAILQPLGYEVLTFIGAEEALQTLLVHPVNLVLVDLAMPIHSGYDLMKSLNDNNVATKIIVVSGKNKDEDIRKALSFGAIDYIMKPFDDDLFISKVNLALQKDAAMAPAGHYSEAVSETPSLLQLSIPHLQVSELGFYFDIPFALPAGLAFRMSSEALTEMNLQSHPLRVTSSYPFTKGNDKVYRNFVSFIGLNPAQLTEVRLWVRSQQLKYRKN